MKLSFVIANILLIAAFGLFYVMERAPTIQGQAASIAVLERQLEIQESNYRMYTQNAIYFEEEQAIIIQPPGHVGALLTEVRSILHAHRLTELEFSVSEQAFYHMEDQYVVQTRGTTLAEGRYCDINAFLNDIASHYRYIRIERVQITKESEPTRMLLTFSIYENQL